MAKKKLIEEGIEAGGSLLDMLFMHNTDASKLARMNEMGGLPMPSIAVTKKDIPFEDYGDITLVGKKSALDPSIKSNKLYSGDAYTVRAPAPIRLANKKAYRQLGDDYAEFSDAGNVDYMRQLLGDLESKSRASSSSYSDAERFFEESPAVIAKFAKENGIEIPMKNGRVDTWALRDIRKDNEFAFQKFSQDEMNKYFQPEQYFDANPNRDYVTGRASLKPYTADNVTAYMKKNAGRAEESSITIGGTGANRAAVTEQLKSLDAARAKRDMLVPREDVSVSNETLSMMQDDLMEALKPYYQYDADGWRYMDEAGGALLNAEKVGLKRSLGEYGFENVPQGLLDEISAWKNELRKAPTQYFEAKPERTVGFNEFAGAIVPENTPSNILDILSRQGIDVQKYSNDAQRVDLRDKFNKEFFIRPETLTGTGLSGLVGYSALNSNKAMANPVDDLRNAESQFNMSPRERAIADLRASEQSFANQPNEQSALYDDATRFTGNVVESLANAGIPRGLMEFLAPDYESSKNRAMGDNSISNSIFAALDRLDPAYYTGLLGASLTNKRGR